MKQSNVWWCYANTGMDVPAFLQASAEAGYEGVELVPPEFYQAVHDLGLTIVTANGHSPIEDGLNRRENADTILKQLTENIQVAAQWQIRSLVCFSGNRRDMDDALGAEIAAETLSKIAPVAEDAGVLLLLETLNSKVDHPDYMGDSAQWCVDVCKSVGSPAVKVLYDIYHMQVMEGDIISTINAHHQIIGHYHTAGCPGRHEIDETQEINYPPIVRAIQETGYDGFLGQEFIPLNDPITSMKQAYDLCSV